MVRGMRKGWMGHEGTGIFRFGFFCRSLLFIRWETGNKKKEWWVEWVCVVCSAVQFGTRNKAQPGRERVEKRAHDQQGALDRAR